MKKNITLEKKVKLALKAAFSKVIADHKLTDDPLYVWKNDRVRRISPFKIK